MRMTKLTEESNRTTKEKLASKSEDFDTAPPEISLSVWERQQKKQLTLPLFEALEIKHIQPRPFLKWVGGKSSVLKQIEPFFPSKIDRYIEPFLGGGSVFFSIKHRFPHVRAFLRDSNKELINCYRIVRDRPVELIYWLDHHSAQ